MKKYFLVANIWKFIQAALLIALGIITIVFSNNESYKYVIGLVAAISLIVDGTLNLSFYVVRVIYHEPRVGLVPSIAELAIGIFIIVLTSQAGNQTLFVDSFALLVALSLIVIGSALIVDSIAKIISKGNKVTSLILEMFIAVLCIALGIGGIFCLNLAANILLIICGSLLIAVGLFYILIIVISLAVAIKAGKTFKEFFESDFSAKDVFKKE